GSLRLWIARIQARPMTGINREKTPPAISIQVRRTRSRDRSSSESSESGAGIVVFECNTLSSSFQASASREGPAAPRPMPDHLLHSKRHSEMEDTPEEPDNSLQGRLREALSGGQALLLGGVVLGSLALAIGAFIGGGSDRRRRAAPNNSSSSSSQGGQAQA